MLPSIQFICIDCCFMFTPDVMGHTSSKGHPASEYSSNSLEHYQDASLLMYLQFLPCLFLAVESCTSCVPIGDNGTNHGSRVMAWCVSFPDLVFPLVRQVLFTVSNVLIQQVWTAIRSACGHWIWTHNLLRVTEDAFSDQGYIGVGCMESIRNKDLH